MPDTRPTSIFVAPGCEHSWGVELSEPPGTLHARQHHRICSPVEEDAPRHHVFYPCHEEDENPCVVFIESFGLS
eukprot:1160000-Pelagomonas_calceolata.AAC.16